jgi:hypothetical protein
VPIAITLITAIGTTSGVAMPRTWPLAPAHLADKYDADAGKYRDTGERIDPEQAGRRGAGKRPQWQRMCGKGGATHDDEKPDDAGHDRDDATDDPGIDHEAGKHRYACRAAVERGQPRQPDLAEATPT